MFVCQYLLCEHYGIAFHSIMEGYQLSVQMQCLNAKLECENYTSTSEGCLLCIFIPQNHSAILFDHRDKYMFTCRCVKSYNYFWILPLITPYSVWTEESVCIVVNSTIMADVNCSYSCGSDCWRGSKFPCLQVYVSVNTTGRLSRLSHNEESWESNFEVNRGSEWRLWMTEWFEIYCCWHKPGSCGPASSWSHVQENS